MTTRSAAMHNHRHRHRHRDITDPDLHDVDRLTAAYQELAQLAIGDLTATDCRERLLTVRDYLTGLAARID